MEKLKLITVNKENNLTTVFTEDEKYQYVYRYGFAFKDVPDGTSLPKMYDKIYLKEKDKPNHLIFKTKRYFEDDYLFKLFMEGGEKELRKEIERYKDKQDYCQQINLFLEEYKEFCIINPF